MHIARGIFMEITHLRYFKKTAELEHITKAAQELHVAQPSLSRTISMLEDELKVKLFNRKGKSIELNEYGIIVLNHTNRILKEHADQAQAARVISRDQALISLRENPAWDVQRCADRERPRRSRQDHP